MRGTKLTSMSGKGKSEIQGRATLVHVARLAGVGLGTASRAINDSGKISVETARRVHEAAERLGYQPNELARSLKVRKSRVVGIVVPDIGGPFMATCVRSAQAVLRKHNYISMLAFTDDDRGIEAIELDYIIRRQIDGILIVHAGCGADVEVDTGSLIRIPMVAFDQPFPRLKVDEVMVANRSGAENATRHLLSHGHKRISYVGIDRDIHTLRSRLSGYRRAMRAASLKESVYLLGPGGEGALKLVDEWLQARKPPTAIFSANELTSVHILEALAARSVSIPDQLAIVAFDDVQLGSLLRPALTAVRQPAAELGHRSATILMDRLLGDLTDPPRRTVLDAELILRQSCGCP